MPLARLPWVCWAPCDRTRKSRRPLPEAHPSFRPRLSLTIRLEHLSGILDSASRAQDRPAATHPVRTVKRAVTPKPIKQVQRAVHPVDNAVYAVERSVSTAIRSGVRTTSKGAKRTSSSGPWPQRFTDSWFKSNVPKISKDQERFVSLVNELHRRGWSDEEIHRRVFRYYRGPKLSS